MTNELLDDERGLWSRMKKALAYASLAGLLFSLLLVAMLLAKPPLAFPDADPTASQSFNDKIQRLVAASEYGMPVEMRFSAAELNSQIQAWLRANPPAEGTASIKNGAVRFEGDRMTVLLALDVRGFDVWMTIHGHLGHAGNIARLDPTEVHLGRVRVPLSLLRGKIDLQSELPEMVTGLRVEGGELVLEVQ